MSLFPAYLSIRTYTKTFMPISFGLILLAIWLGSYFEWGSIVRSSHVFAPVGSLILSVILVINGIARIFIAAKLTKLFKKNQLIRSLIAASMAIDLFCLYLFIKMSAVPEVDGGFVVFVPFFLTLGWLLASIVMGAVIILSNRGHTK